MVQKSCSPGQKLKGEQKRRGKAKGTKRSRGNGSKATGAEISNATTPSVVEEAGNATSAGDNRACSNGRSREDKSGNGMLITKGRAGTMQPLYVVATTRYEVQ